jgi:hypothetical protein
MSHLDLMTWESYLISVSVVNNVGIGPASEVVKVRTLEGIPSRAPAILRCEPLNSTALTIQWQGPAASYINGILNAFKVTPRRALEQDLSRRLD